MIMIRTKYDELTNEKKVYLSFNNSDSPKAKINLIKDVIREMFDEEEMENLYAYLDKYKPLTWTQLRNRKIYKAIQEEDLSTLNELLPFSKLTGIKKYYGGRDVIKLTFDNFELPDLKVLNQFREEYILKLNIVISPVYCDVWIIEMGKDSD